MPQGTYRPNGWRETSRFSRHAPVEPQAPNGPPRPISAAGALDGHRLVLRPHRNLVLVGPHFPGVTSVARDAAAHLIAAADDAARIAAQNGTAKDYSVKHLRACGVRF